ncbi:MAG: stage IV sporulation protein A [Ruminococcaceae bacterium]|nr:stage IV sporulation protein A [Oscillospiraceae bacterium]MBQ9692045.1 stage IV sporulation protein A [Clostridia bacterium]
MSITQNIYKDIAKRTGGTIIIGVVGPVRTGKSTFIKRFMEQLVLPNIADPFERERAKDEMPQTAAGKTVMTTEPKFVPENAVRVNLGDGAVMNVKLADCVGYVVPEALGTVENGQSRMVLTPWSDEPMSFEKAAEIGTKKVIYEHSTVGVLVTTDGSIGELPRSVYEQAEKRVVDELRSIGKPFVILLNSADPGSESAINLAYELEKSYGAPVALVSALELNSEDIKHLMELLLLEFPVKMIDVELPSWTQALDGDHWLTKEIRSALYGCVGNVRKLGEIPGAFNALFGHELIKDAYITSTDCGSGVTHLEVKLKDQLYYKVISELTGFDIESEEDLVNQMRSLSAIKEKYDKIEEALNSVNERGYGIVMPDIADLTLAEPEIIKRGSGYGVKLKASAPSIHMIKANIETEINPIVGSEQQSEDLIKYLLSEFEESPASIWNSNLFGKTLYELVTEGLHTKLDNMPDDARAKLGETLEKIVNDGSGGLICILL